MLTYLFISISIRIMMLGEVKVQPAYDDDIDLAFAKLISD